jgi:hypothetical protein
VNGTEKSDQEGPKSCDTKTSAAQEDSSAGIGKGNGPMNDEYIPPLDEQQHTPCDVWRTVPDGILYREFARYWL